MGSIAMRAFILLFFLAAGCAVVAVSDTPETQPGLVDGVYEIRRVVDGDTVIVENVGRLRLSNFDAPEQDSDAGKAMTRRMEDLATGERVWIRFRRNKHGQPVSGYYGRLLGELWLPWGAVAEGR